MSLLSTSVRFEIVEGGESVKIEEVGILWFDKYFMSEPVDHSFSL